MPPREETIVHESVTVPLLPAATSPASAIVPILHVLLVCMTSAKKTVLQVLHLPVVQAVLPVLLIAIHLLLHQNPAALQSAPRKTPIMFGV
jgi:hypothetical protein